MSLAYHLFGSREAEISMESAFAVAYTNTKFHDITLQASDGVQVRANRTILGVRSPVFRKLLFGDFQEAGSDIVNVDYPGDVVKALVQYIYTNHVSISQATQMFAAPLSDDRGMREVHTSTEAAKSRAKEIPEQVQEDIQMILTLTAAAAYYGLPKFCYFANLFLPSFVHDFPLLAWSVLDASSQAGPVITEGMKQVALSKIPELLADKTDDSTSLGCFSPTALESLLVDSKIRLSETHQFLLIDQWCQAGSTDQDRSAIAKKLVTDHVDLQYIDPDELETSVAPSGLVTAETLAKVCSSQAKRAKHHSNVLFSKKQKRFTFPNPTWRVAGSATVSNETDIWQSDTLKSPVLLLGRKYTWTVDITGSSVWLGVLHSYDRLTSDSFAGTNTGCHGFCGRDGELSSFGKKIPNPIAAILKHGDRVTMTLDLSSEADRNGFLAVSVNGQSTIVLHDGMCDIGDIQGFTPVVSCAECEVTLVHFEF